MKIRIPFAYGLIAILLGSNAVAPPSAKGLTFEIVETPAAAGSLAPNLCAFGNQFVLSWIQRGSNRTASVRVASWNGKAFGATRTVAMSKQMFANWADIPSVIEAPSGDLYAHWLDRISSKTYAYGIRIARSTDHGKTWKPIGWLHNDTSPTEHGFVSFAPEGKHIRAFWLDGRAMAKKGGKMMLRTAILDGNKIKDERVLDDDVCTCCPTSAASLSTGPMVIYRDRSPKEIRDIAFTRRDATGWTPPALVHADNWFFPACPVNGASIATYGNLIAISRYTIANNKAKIILRLSKTDKPKSSQDIILDANNPTGRCATVCTKDAVYTIWIGQKEKQTALQLAQVSHTGKLIRKTTLTKIEGTRSSGMPRAVISDGCLWVTWTDANRVQLGWLKITTN
jgi:hypothetical protein